MNWDSVGLTAGIAVLVSGAITLGSISNDSEADGRAVTTTAPATKIVAAGSTQASLLPLPDLPGVAPEIQRVLYSRGSAQPVTVEQLSGVPIEVTSVLSKFGSPLMIPDAGGTGDE